MHLAVAAAAPVTEAPKHVEIHFDTKHVDHPLVPIRWCLSRTTTAYMRANPRLHWALLIVVQERPTRDEQYGVSTTPDNRKESRLLVEGVDAIARGQDFLQFRAPGDYDVVGYLLSSFGTDAGSHRNFWDAARKLVKRERGRYSYTHNTMFPATPEHDGESKEPAAAPTEYRVAKLSRDHLAEYATDHLRAVIPPGIFAAELPRWVRIYLNHIGLGVGEDQCAGRWRLALAFTIAPIIYGVIFTVAYVVVHLWAVILGLLHLLCGGNPFVPWKMFATWEIIHEDFDSFWLRYEFERLPPFEAMGVFLTPLIWVIVAGISWAAFTFTSVGWWVLIGLVATIAILAFLEAAGESLGAMLKKQAETAGEEKALAGIERIEQYAVCGLPDTGTRTVRFSWTGIKRTVCKPRSV